MTVSLELRWPDYVLIILSLVTAHLYFVREILSAPIVGFVIAFAVFKGFKQSVAARMSLVLSLFATSYFLMRIDYPVVGRLFWPVDHFVGALFLFVGIKALRLPLERPRWSFRFDSRMRLSIAVITVPTLIVLCIYFHFHSEIARQWPFPKLSLWMMPVSIVLISLVNGLREEIFFRFTLQNGLSTLGSPVTAIACSSIFFGYIHYVHGFPQGGLGVLLTFLYGILVGAQFYFFKSATLTWLTHSLADAVMFVIILYNQ